MNARLAIWKRADFFEAKWVANNKISLSQGQSYTEREYYKSS